MRGEAFNFGTAIALGVGLGAAYGAALGNIATGMVVGLALATVANAYHEKRQGRKRAGIALVIALGGLVMVVLVLALSRVGWAEG